MTAATARAYANIALAKYWGKSDEKLNLPAVPSISVTLAPLSTTTTVTLLPSRAPVDELLLDGARANDKELARAVAMVDRFRERAHSKTRVRITSRNDFPTAAGLASSASGFAALAAATSAAFGVDASLRELSAEARQASASAARSVFGGYVELPAGKPGDAKLAARPIAEPSHFDLAVVIAITARGRKLVGSTDGMLHTQRTSPFYDAWVERAPKLARAVKRAVLDRDLARLGPAMEASTFAMHASAMAAVPHVVYLRPPTLEVLEALRVLRTVRGVPVFATMDAGPHVKAVCIASDAKRIARILAKVPGVSATIIARPAAGVSVETHS